MSLKILLDNQIVEEHNYLPDSKYKFKLRVLPFQVLTLIVDGKNPHDTKIDEYNNIIEDKFIKVDRCVVNNIPVHNWILESCFFEFENQQGHISTSNYFGQNGKTQIRFSDSSLKFFLHTFSK